MRRQGEKVVEVPGKADTIFTGFKKISLSELEEIAQIPEGKRDWVEARYHLQITIAPEVKGGSRVAIQAIILVKGSPAQRKGPPYPMGPVRPSDWLPVRSKGTLEREWLKILQAHCSL